MKVRLYEVNTDAATVDWGGMKQDLNSRMDELRTTWEWTQAEGKPELHQRVCRERYAPLLVLVAQFCAGVEEITEARNEHVN